MTPYEQTDALLSEQVKPKAGGFFSLPEVDGYKYDPMALPAGSMPEDDQVVGYDEFGFKIRKNTAGNTYTIQPVKQKEDISLSERAGNVAENVGSAYQAVKEDPVGTATGLAKGLAQGVAKTVSAFSDPSATTQDALNVAGMLTLGASAATAPAGALRTGAARNAGPASRQKVPRYLSGNKPQVSPLTQGINAGLTGTKRLRDIFEEDEAALDNLIEANFLEGDNFTSVDNPNDLGYARDMNIHTLAQIKLGQTSVEDALDYIGTDPNPATVDYVNSRLQRLDNNPEFNDYLSMLREQPDFDPYVKDSFDPLFAGPTVFRSAIPEVVELIDFPNKGLEGYQLVAELRKNPSLRKSELDTVLDSVDPKARYSKDEALDLINKNVWDVTVTQTDGYRSYQRQDELLDPESEYFVFTVDAQRPENTFKSNSQHFEPSTLAHTRGSFRTDEKNGYGYALIEEKQTDLLQKGFAEPRKAKSKLLPSEAVDKFFEGLPENSGLDDNDKELLKILGESRHRSLFNLQRYKDFITKVGPTNLLDTSDSPNSLLGLPKEDDTQIVLDHVLNQRNTEPYAVLLDLYAQYKHPKDTKGAAEDYKDGLVDTYYAKVADNVVPKDMPAISAPPIKKIEESVALTMNTLIAESSVRGVTHIVMPPFERIVNKRFPKDLYPDEYAKAMDPSSGFYKTYVTSFQKYLKDKQEEVGKENFSWRQKDLNYDDPDYLPVTGTEIDFTGLFNSGYDLSRPALAEGGLVEDKQMNELMQEGGMADDGMSQEPTTGNDIPPGALASEVRDDVDAKLSEGEYVVPADVVRYFGVSFFEGLRTKAKEGLSEMEADGRIGGTPVDAQGVPVEDDMDELSPEEEQMLQQAMGMAEGGDVGGFDRTKFTLTPTDRSGFGANAVTETRQYFNPTTGKKASVQFMDGMALGVIPAGFVPWSQTLEDSYNTTKPTPRESSSSNSSSSSGNTMTTTGGNNSSGASFDYTKWADTNADAIKSNPYEFGMKALEDKSGNLTNKAIGIAGLATGLLPLAMLGAGLGAANKLQNVAEANAALKIMDSRGLTDSPEYQALAGKVKEYISDLPLAQQGAIATKVAATGNQYIEAIEAKSGNKAPTTMTSAPTQRTPVQPASNSGSSSTATRVSIPNTTPTSFAPASSPKPVARPTTTAAPATTKVVSTPAGNKTVTVAPKPVVSQASRNGFEDGGLVTKPKKTTPKSKGLGGKQ